MPLFFDTERFRTKDLDYNLQLVLLIVKKSINKAVNISIILSVCQIYSFAIEKKWHRELSFVFDEWDITIIIIYVHVSSLRKTITRENYI